YWLLLATRGLPGHQDLWEALGYAFTVMAALLLGWATTRVAGRWGGVTAGAAALLVSPFALRPLMTLFYHVPNPFTAGVLGPYPLRLLVAVLVIVAIAAPVVAALKLALARAAPLARAFACYWGAASVLLCLAFVVTPNARDLGPPSTYYLLTLPLAAGAGIALLAARSDSAQLVVALGVALVGAVNLSGIADRRPGGPPPPLPPGAAEVLRLDHPRLAEYVSRYRGHPAATSSQWSNDYISSSIDIRQFRGHSGYVWQQWGEDVFRYGLTTYFMRLHDRLGLFERLEEDGLFGAERYDIDGVHISRDLLDSIAELTFLDDQL